MCCVEIARKSQYIGQPSCVIDPLPNSHVAVVDSQHSSHRLADFHVIRDLHPVYHPLHR